MAKKATPPEPENVLANMTPPPEPTLEEMGVNLEEGRPIQRVVEFHDAPPDDPPAELNVQRVAAETTPLVAAPAPLGRMSFVSRIAVTDAYQFDGRMHAAPAWVDRNWMAFEDGKPAVRVEAGGRVVLCRMGDWIVKQDIVTDAGDTEHDRVTCLTDAEFRRFFVRRTEP